jgi:hypothetical protein
MSLPTIWNVLRSSWKVPDILVSFNRFLSRTNTELKKKSVQWESPCYQLTDRQTDRQDDATSRFSLLMWRRLGKQMCIHAARGFDTTSQSSIAEGSARNRSCDYCNRQLAQITNAKPSSQLVGSCPEGLRRHTQADNWLHGSASTLKTIWLVPCKWNSVLNHEVSLSCS